MVSDEQVKELLEHLTGDHCSCDWRDEMLQAVTELRERRERERWISVETVPPVVRQFISGQGWQPKDKPYYLVVDAKERMAVAYPYPLSDGAVEWVSGKSIGIITHWRPLPKPPAGERA